MAFVGGGVAVNVYRANSGERTSMNPELKGSANSTLDTMQTDGTSLCVCPWEYGYFQLDPWFFRTSDLKPGIIVGHDHFENTLRRGCSNFHDLTSLAMTNSLACIGDLEREEFLLSCHPAHKKPVTSIARPTPFLGCHFELTPLCHQEF